MNTDRVDGPERLENDARPARRATWLVLAVAVVLVAGLGVVRFTGVLPGPTPPTPGPSPTETRLGGWPEGIGGGTLYVLDAEGVASVDVSSGRVQRSALRIDPTLVSLAAGGAGVLVWYPDGNGTPHLVAARSADTPTVGPVLARARQVLPGPGESMWTTEEVGLDDEGTPDRWRLVGTDDTVLDTVSLTGTVKADGAGGLFVHGADARVVHVVDGEPSTTWRGGTGAVGLQGWEERRCVRGTCRSALHDRSSGAETPLTRVTSSDFQAPVLSLGSRFVASLQPPSGSRDDRLVVRVAVPGAERALRSFPASDENGNGLVWLSDRWLAASGDTGLVLYDAVDDRLVPLDSTLVLPRELVLRPV